MSCQRMFKNQENMMPWKLFTPENKRGGVFKFKEKLTVKNAVDGLSKMGSEEGSQVIIHLE